MNVTIHPGPLSGRVRVPASKSLAHRWLIASALGEENVSLADLDWNEDLSATAQALEALGATIACRPGEAAVRPIPQTLRRAPGLNPATLDCRESGSTLRFMMPVAAALGRRATFVGKGRLPQRPQGPLVEVLHAHGTSVSGEGLPLALNGALVGGRFDIAGNCSSQYITGLLLALPLCPEGGTIHLTTPLESAPYVEITLSVLKACGIRVDRTADSFSVPGGQRYRPPERIAIEGDWSAAGYWLAANRLGAHIAPDNLRGDSPQGDRRILEHFETLGGAINVSDTPDAVPALAVVAALTPGRTRIVGGARLRLKESDRIASTAGMLRALGASADETEDGLIITGTDALAGGVVDGFGDHRIVMAAAIAALRAQSDVTILGAQAVEKSYPAFFDDYARLGGKFDVQCDR